jgi:hypothetical protein
VLRVAIDSPPRNQQLDDDADGGESGRRSSTNVNNNKDDDDDNGAANVTPAATNLDLDDGGSKFKTRVHTMPQSLKAHSVTVALRAVLLLLAVAAPKFGAAMSSAVSTALVRCVRECRLR